MKSIIYTTFLSLSLLVSCQNKRGKNLNNIQNKEILNDNYLKISMDNGVAFIEGLSSINDETQSDYTITSKINQYLVTKKFLESDDWDGKKIII